MRRERKEGERQEKRQEAGRGGKGR